MARLGCSRRKPRAHTLRSDDARTQVLEAVLVACIMVSGVAYVITFDAPAPADDVVARHLERRLDDFVVIAAETPLSGACRGGTLLEEYAIEGVNGAPDTLVMKKNKMFGPQEQLNAHLDNGIDKYPLHVEFEGYGQAGERMWFGPDWTWAASHPLHPVSGTETLRVDSYALQHNRLLRPLGEAVRVTVTVDGDLHDQELTRWGVSAMPGEADVAREFGQNVTWMHVDDPDAVSLVREFRLKDLAPTTLPDFKLRVDPAVAGQLRDQRVLPAGLETTVRVPRDWAFNLTLTARDNNDWLVTATGNATTGWEILFTLRESLPTSDTIVLRAQPPATPTKPFDILHARLGNGSLGESTLVVEYPDVVDASLPREVFLTMPYPVRNGTSALLGVAFANGGDQVNVTRIDIEVPGGYDTVGPYARQDGSGAALFNDSAAPMDPSGGTGAAGAADGWTTLGPRHLQWRGNRTVDASTATFWAIGANITEDVGEATSLEPPKSRGLVGELRFPNGFASRSSMWGSAPGVIRHEVAPASTPASADGYPWSPVAGAARSYAYVARLSSIHGDVENASATYQVVPSGGGLVQVQGALGNSTFQVGNRSMPLGGLLQAQGNLKATITRLSALGVTDARITVGLYPPSSMGCEPAATWRLDASSRLMAAIRALEVYDATGSGAAAGVVLVADDGNAYRVDALGQPQWSSTLSDQIASVGPHVGTALDVEAVEGGTTHVVVVGLDDGNVTGLEYATGQPLWTTRLASGLVTSVQVNATTDQALATTRDGTVALLDALTGRVVAARETAADNGTFLTAAWGANGDVYALHENGLERLDATLGWRGAHRAATDQKVVGFALTPAGVLFTQSSNVLSTTLVLEPGTFVEQGSVPHPAAAALAAAGDATGDGIPDWVVAMETLGVDIVDGATGSYAGRVEPIMSLGNAGTQVDPFAPMDYHPGDDGRPGYITGEERFSPCEDGKRYHLTYQEPGEVCVSLDNQYAKRVAPLALHVEDGRILYGYRAAGLHHAEQWHVRSGGSWSRVLTTAQQPLAVGLGPWIGGTTVAVIGASDGSLTAMDAGTGIELWSETPTQFMGTFNFQTLSPRGGFFGTHTIVVDLDWTGTDGVRHHARLADWFEAVQPDGRPNERDGYHVVFLARDAIAAGSFR